MLGDRIQLANCALLAGHVKIEDGVILSGHTAIHHFVTLGTLCMLGGLTGVTHDVPPYMTMLIDHRTPRGVNIVGMQRNGFSDAEIDSVQRVWRMLYRSGLSKESAAKELEAAGLMTKPAQNLLEFMRRSETGKLGAISRGHPAGARRRRVTRLKVGVIGVGHLGKEHARVYAGLEDAELVGVVDSDADAARAVARKFKTEWSATPDFLLDRAQAVSVVVPTLHHHAVALPFLQRGISVLVEKPMT